MKLCYSTIIMDALKGPQVTNIVDPITVYPENLLHEARKALRYCLAFEEVPQRANPIIRALLRAEERERERCVKAVEQSFPPELPIGKYTQEEIAIFWAGVRSGIANAVSAIKKTTGE